MDGGQLSLCRILLTMTTRRQFLGAAAGACASVPAARAQSAEAKIEVILNEALGTISKDIYGHFVEHLGGVVYDGIWVGENSTIANVGGLRKQLVDALAKVKPGVIRWPGGCFADQYDWRDGAGPRGKRPKRTNFWVDSPEWPKNARRDGPQVYDPNSFGSVEFARFCKLTGAAPYFAANLRSLPAQEFWRWVEYCNSPAGSTTLAEQRAADGEREPLNVRFWGVGNESWGCGGNFAPEDYAIEYKRFAAWVPRYGVPLALVGSGPNGGDLNWTRKFFEKAARSLNGMWGWALHHYSWNASGGRTTDWFSGKRDALTFDAEQYYEILREGDRMEELIRTHWEAMGEFDKRRRVKLVVDEWGAWYAPGTEPFPEALLGQQNTMRDAVLAGMSLDTFNRHADKVAMANVAQLVNCLQSLFLAHEDQFCVTPTYHVFDLYAAHQGAQSVRVEVAAPPVAYTRNEKPASVRGLSASASLRDKQLTLTVTNPSLDQPREVAVALRGASPRSVKAVTLGGGDAHAHNTFRSPREVEPREQAASLRGAALMHRFPPASVTRLEIALG
jgi:alpha-N-arabinofuranosidase